MSGWLEFFTLDIICPNCNKSFEALYCENANIREPPEIKTFLSSGKTTCPHCSSEITEDQIQLTQE